MCDCKPAALDLSAIAIACRKVCNSPGPAACMIYQLHVGGQRTAHHWLAPCTAEILKQLESKNPIRCWQFWGTPWPPGGYSWLMLLSWPVHGAGTLCCQQKQLYRYMCICSCVCCWLSRSSAEGMIRLFNDCIPPRANADPFAGHAYELLNASNVLFGSLWQLVPAAHLGDVSLPAWNALVHDLHLRISSSAPESASQTATVHSLANCCAAMHEENLRE